MNGKNATIVSLMVGCLLFVGCTSFRKVGGENDRALKNGLPGTLLGNDSVDERALCIETATMVASNGHASEAIQLFEKAEKLDASQTPLDLELAPLYAQVGKHELAITRYQNAIDRGIAGADEYNNLAWTLKDANQFGQALQIVQQGLAVAPDNDRLLSTQAIILYEQDDREGALSVFRKLHGPSAAHHNLAVLDIERGDLNAALEQANLAANSPDCVEATFELRNALASKLSTVKTSGPR